MDYHFIYLAVTSFFYQVKYKVKGIKKGAKCEIYVTNVKRDRSLLIITKKVNLFTDLPVTTVLEIEKMGHLFGSGQDIKRKLTAINAGLLLNIKNNLMSIL
jgi:hypothetical protein